MNNRKKEEMNNIEEEKQELLQEYNKMEKENEKLIEEVKKFKR